MLLGSFLLIGHPIPDEDDDKSAPDSIPKVERILFMVRLMRGFIIGSKLLCYLIDTVENRLIIKILRCIEIFYYMGVILFQQYYVIRHPPHSDPKGWFVYRAKLWMLMEVLLFYTLIVATMIFLIYIQLRGLLGYKNYDMNKNRFKYDAIDYYEFDISWF